MMNLKQSTQNLLLVSALAFGIPIVGLAAAGDMPSPPPQGEPCGGPRGGPEHGPFGRMSKDLNLTAAQQEQLQNILKKQHEETKKQIFQILTPEQKTKAQALEEQHKNAMKNKPCGGPPPKAGQ